MPENSIPLGHHRQNSTNLRGDGATWSWSFQAVKRKLLNLIWLERKLSVWDGGGPGRRARSDPSGRVLAESQRRVRRQFDEMERTPYDGAVRLGGSQSFARPFFEGEPGDLLQGMQRP